LAARRVYHCTLNSPFIVSYYPFNVHLITEPTSDVWHQEWLQASPTVRQTIIVNNITN
jgi:hypothetical protein